VYYTATVDTIRDNNVCLVTIKQDGKYLCDHLWVQSDIVAERYEKGTEIVFSAIAYTYKDSNGVRKTGIDQCRSFRECNEEYYAQVKKDGKNLKKRNYK
tara:strand:+ start:5702 stop:5998 length:297 start_codon:yes stop_codon:yes gene_type:complete